MNHEVVSTESIGLAELKLAIIRVGAGRGFLIPGKLPDERFVVTAAHCLPYLPAPHLARDWDEGGVYLNLVGPMDAEPTITVGCVFCDSVADVAVLGPPDDQEFSDDHHAWAAFVGALPPFDVAWPPVRQRMRPSGWTEDDPPNFTPGEAKFAARVLSLEGEWVDVEAAHCGGGIWLTPSSAVCGGMSGSPLIGLDGAALGVISTNNVCSPLAAGLPGWLIRQLGS
jgi:hypothetical protein